MKQLFRWSSALCLLIALISMPAWAKQKDQNASVDELANVLSVTPIWSARTGPGYGKRYLRLAPATDSGRVFAADWKGSVFAYQAKTGKLIWKQDWKAEITGGLSFAEGLVLFGTGDAHLYALDAEDGTLRWKAGVSSEVVSTPRLANGIAIVQTNDGKIFGINAANGKTLWTEQRSVPVLTLRGTGSPAVSAQGIVVAGHGNGKLSALDMRNGTLLWEASIAVPQGRSELQRMVDIDADPLIIRGVVYAVAYQGRIAALDLNTGRLLWTRDMSSYVGMTGDERNLYVTGTDSTVYALDRQSGATLWKQEDLRGKVLSKPVIDQGYLIAGDDSGTLYWMSLQDGKLVSRITIETLTATLKGLEWDLWEDYSRSGLRQFYKENSGINYPPIDVGGHFVALDNKGRVVAFQRKSNQ